MESKFVLKLSALEIYNETVVDLLNRDSGALRLLDDPDVNTKHITSNAFITDKISIFFF